MIRRAKLAVYLVICCSSFCFADETGSSESSDLKKLLEGALSPLESVVGQVTELGKIVVTPTKVEEKLGAQSSSVTVLDAPGLDRQKIEYVKSALKDEMAIDVVENSSFTGQTSVFMRGANSNHTLVMIDGLRVYDPISPSGTYNFANLTMDNIDRIEIVRGPQSALYGSDAIGGVISIMTKKAEGTFANTSFEAGSFSTFRETFSMGSKVNGLHYTIGGSSVNSVGISNAQSDNNNPERDNYARYALSARVDYDVYDDLTIGTTFRNTSTFFNYDQFRKDYPNLRQRNYETLFTGYIDHRLTDFYNYYIKMGWLYNFRRDVDSRFNNSYYDLRDWYSGYEFRFDYRNTFNLLDIDTFTIGYEYTWEMGDYYYHLSWGSGDTTDDMPKVFDRNSALYLENRVNLNDRLTATQGMRLDVHSVAGSHVTYKVDGSYLFPTATKVRGGWATGFKAPTLYQLNAVSTPSDAWGWGGFGGGNKNLRPETSQSYEIGIDQYLFGDKVILDATYFNMMIYDLINTTTNEMFYTSQFMNTGKAKSYGIEFGAKARPMENLELRCAYTYNYTKDLSTDRPLLRRPLNKMKVVGWWEILPKWDVTAEVLIKGVSYDVNVDKLKPYAIVNLTTNYKLSKNFSFYLKIDNMFNKRYEEVRGYGMSPLAVYCGTRADF